MQKEVNDSSNNRYSPHVISLWKLLYKFGMVVYLMIMGFLHAVNAFLVFKVWFGFISSFLSSALVCVIGWLSSIGLCYWEINPSLFKYWSLENVQDEFSRVGSGTLMPTIAMTFQITLFCLPKYKVFTVNFNFICIMVS